MPAVSSPPRVAGLSDAVFGTWFGRSDSPWPVPFPPLPPQTVAHYGPCSEVSPVLWDCLTSHVRSSLSCSLGIHSADLLMRPNVGPPGSRARSLCTCSGSLTTQGPNCTSRYRYSRCCLPPLGQRGHPEAHFFRGSITLPAHPLSTLRLYPYEYRRMTRGRCGPLTLHRMELSSTTPHRFLPAHPK